MDPLASLVTALAAGAAAARPSTMASAKEGAPALTTPMTHHGQRRTHPARAVDQGDVEDRR